MGLKWHLPDADGVGRAAQFYEARVCLDRGKGICRLHCLELNPEQESAMVASGETLRLDAFPLRDPTRPSTKTDSGTGDQLKGLARV